MSGPSIRAEAVEAAAKAICESDLDPNPERELEERWNAFEDDSSVHAEYRANARAAIAAFCEAEGLRVERQVGAGVGWSQEPTHQRLIGPWRNA